MQRRISDSEWCLYDLLLRNVVRWVELVATATDSVTIMVTTHAIVITDGVTRKSHSRQEQTASQSAAPLKIFMHYRETDYNIRWKQEDSKLNIHLDI